MLKPKNPTPEIIQKEKSNNYMNWVVLKSKKMHVISRELVKRFHLFNVLVDWGSRTRRRGLGFDGGLFLFFSLLFDSWGLETVGIRMDFDPSTSKSDSGGVASVEERNGGKFRNPGIGRSR